MSQESYLKEAHERYNELMAQAMRKQMNRRLFMKASTLAAMGGAAAVNGLIAACAGGGEESKITTIAAAGTYQYSRYPLVEKYNWRKLPWGGTPYIDGIAHDRVSAPSGWDFLKQSLSSYGGRFMNVLMHMRYGAGANMERVNLEPDLADKVSHAPDYSYYDYHIRQNKYFHDIPPVNGRKLTAKDVVDCYNLYKNESIWSAPLDPIEKVEVLEDGETVRITPKRPILWMNELVATSTYWIFPPEYSPPMGGDKKTFRRQPIGSGPFKVLKSEYRKGTDAVRHPKYNQTDDRWKGYTLPFLKEWHGIYFGDAAAEKSAFRTGQVDWVYIRNFSEFNDMLATNPDATISIIPHDPAVYVGFMFQQKFKPFRDVRVRRAMSMALDREAIVDTAVGGMATRGGYPIGYDFLGLDEPIPLEEQGPWHQYNPEKAKELLAEAGYPNGFEMTITTPSPVPDYTLLTAKFLEQIGIRVKFDTVETAVYTAARTSGDFEHMIFKPTIPGYSGVLVMNNLFKTGSPQNSSGISDPVLDELTEKATYSLDPDEQRRLYKEFNDRVLDQVWMLYVYNMHRVFFRQKWLHNLADHIHSWAGYWGSWQWAIGWIDDTAPADRRGRLKT